MVAIQESVGVAGPIFVRKLRRKDDWGNPADPLDVRIQNAVTAFLTDSPPYSLFLISTDAEFHHVILGTNATRGGTTPLLKTADFVAFTAAELQNCQIVPRHSPQDGTTPCRHANSLHWDLAASKEQLERLCRTVMELARPTAHLTKADLKPLVEKATQDQCLAAVPDSSECKADACPPP